MNNAVYITKRRRSYNCELGLFLVVYTLTTRNAKIRDQNRSDDEQLKTKRHNQKKNKNKKADKQYEPTIVKVIAIPVHSNYISVWGKPQTNFEIKIRYERCRARTNRPIFERAAKNEKNARIMAKRGGKGRRTRCQRRSSYPYCRSWLKEEKKCSDRSSTQLGFRWIRIFFLDCLMTRYTFRDTNVSQVHTILTTKFLKFLNSRGIV